MAKEVTDKVHPLIGVALRAIPKRERPRRTWHLGGPPPQLDGIGITRLVIEIGEAVLARAPEDVLLAERIAELRRLLSLPFAQPPPRGENSLNPRYLELASAMWHGGRTSDTMLNRVVTAAAKRVEPAELVTLVDDALMRTELVRALEIRNLPHDVARVVWRHSAKPRRRADHFFGTLADGRCVLLFHMPSGKQEWVKLIGTADETLAAVPDAFFEEVSRAYFTAIR